MTVLLFWLVALVLFGIASELGRRLGLIPIVSQLLLATLGLPLLMYFWIEPGWHLSGAELIAPDWLKNLYSLAFALLLGHILSDVIDLRLDRQSLKIALPSFVIPFACGLATAIWLLPTQPWISSLAVGLLFAITAIPVLYLYLRHIDYPPAATRRLVQTAILIDLTCWTLFALAQGSLQVSSLLLPLAGACLPLVLRVLGLRQPLADLRRKTRTFAHKVQAHAVLLELGHFTAQRQREQLHEARHLVCRAVPVFGREGVQRQALQLGRLKRAHQPAHCLYTALMADRARQAPFLGPAAIAIHDDGDMSGARLVQACSLRSRSRNHCVRISCSFLAAASSVSLTY